MKRMITRISLMVLCLVTLLSTVSCSKAPELSEVKDSIVALIESSYEVNDLFFGEGLPTYERGSEEANKLGIYMGVDETYRFYEYIKPDSPYVTVDAIKIRAEEVYSRDYLDDVFERAFDGIALDVSEDILFPRFLETEDWLMQYIEKPLITETRRYRFDTITIVKPSRADYVNFTIDSYLESAPDEILNVRLAIVLEDGVWKLDAPTY